MAVFNRYHTCSSDPCTVVQTLALWPEGRIRLFVHHHADFSENIEHMKCLSVISILSSVCLRLIHSLDYLSCNIWCNVFSTCLCLSWWLLGHFTSTYYHHQIGNMNHYPLFRVWSWNNVMRCLYSYVLITSLYVCCMRNFIAKYL